MQELDLKLFLNSILAVAVSGLVGIAAITAVGSLTTSPFIMLPLLFATVLITMVMIVVVRDRTIESYMKMKK
ncbi:hypothetical protein [Acinetobacter sp. YH12153]|uniref:hypothetical protein n=1 Tax=Acinetobacter sp. YH12153 TaxID=2601133 RepID=UPI0015D38046|nr:hypothetical protein [Acinetobacter sp. YH12153]